MIQIWFDALNAVILSVPQSPTLWVIISIITVWVNIAVTLYLFHT